MAKVLHIISLVLLLAAAGIGIQNRGNYVAKKNEVETTKGLLAAETQKANKAAAEARDAAEKLVAEQGKREAAEKDVASMTAKLEGVREELSKANASVAEKDAEIARLKEAPQAPGGAPAADPGRIGELEAQVKELQTVLQTKENEVRAATERADAAVAEAATFKQKEMDRAKGLMRKGAEGKILAYNPAWNFVVLSIGDRQGAVPGAEMVVARGTESLGRVKITSVEPSISIADVVLSSVPTGARIAPGDKVIFQTQ